MFSILVQMKIVLIESDWVQMKYVSLFCQKARTGESNREVKQYKVNLSDEK